MNKFGRKDLSGNQPIIELVIFVKTDCHSIHICQNTDSITKNITFLETHKKEHIFGADQQVVYILS